MTHTRYIMLFATLSLLSACGDSSKQTTATTPEASTEAAAPPVAYAGAEAGAEVDASTLFARSCASCHGETAEGVAGNPSLVKLSHADIKSRLETYRSGGTVGPKSAIMAPMVKNLSDQEIAALASYLGN